MLGERITTLANLLDRIKLDVLKTMNVVWNTGQDIEKDSESIKTDILSAYTDHKIFKEHFKKLSSVEKIASMFVSELPSGMSLKDIINDLSKEKGWDKKRSLDILKRLFNEYFCIPLKSSTDMILFIPKEFRVQMSRMEDIDESRLTMILADMLSEIMDVWSIKRICKNIGISVAGMKKQLTKRIGQETTFDNMMTVVSKSEVQDLISFINNELDLGLFTDGSKSELVIQLRKNGKHIINNYKKNFAVHPISPLRQIFHTIKEKELNYKNQDKIFPARRMIGYLYYSDDYIANMEDCYNRLSSSLYDNTERDDLLDATDILYDLNVILIDSEEEEKMIRLNPEFYKESSVNIEDYITKGTDVAEVYGKMEINDKFLLAFVLENHVPIEIDVIKERFNLRFEEDLFEGSFSKLIRHNFVFISQNKHNKHNMITPLIFRKKLRDLITNDEVFVQISSIINVSIDELYEKLDSKEKLIHKYEKRLIETEEELETLRKDFSQILMKERDIDEIEIINEKNRLLFDNSQLIKRNRTLRNDLMELKSRVIIYEDNWFDIEEFRELSLSETNKDKFAESLVIFLQSIGLSAKLNEEEEEGPVILSVASAPDVALMIDFKLGKTLEEDLYPFGMHFQNNQYINKSELKYRSKILKLFIANEFPEDNSIIRLAKKYSVKLIRIEQLMDIFNIYNIMPISQQELINLFNVESEKDIFVKSWEISELNKLISERRIQILRGLLIYNELYKATDINYDSRDAEGIYNSVKQSFIEKQLDPASEDEIKLALENFSSPLLQMAMKNGKNKHKKDHFTPLLKPEMLIKQIKFLSKYISSEITDDLIIDDI